MTNLWYVFSCVLTIPEIGQPKMASVKVLLALLAVAWAAPKPHVIFFVIDDMGWSNIGYHNDNAKTPNLDQAAADGVILDRQYTFWYCSPTRSSLMTGRYPLHVSEDNENAETVMGAVPVEMTMLPAKLKTVGYATHHVGKWHLGQIKAGSVPGARGFDTSVGYLGGAEDHYNHTNGGCGCHTAFDLYNGTTGPYYKDADVYGDLLYNELATDTIRRHDASQPLFMYYAAQVLHAPQEAPDRFVNLYNTSYSGDFRIEQGMASVADEAFGNLTQALKDAGMYDNTLIYVGSDNGGPAAKTVSGHSANNYPLRGGKRTAWEGGVRVNSFITGGFVEESMRGKVLDDYIHVADWYPTIAKLAGVDPSDPVPNMPGVDGMDLWPYLSGQTTSSNRTELPLVSGSRGAIIVGDYKLVRGEQDYGFWQGPVYPNQTTDHKHEPQVLCGTGCLFNIREDPTEHNDLAKTMPDKFNELLQRAQYWDAKAFKPDRGTFDKSLCCDYMKNHRGFCGPVLP
eukprot:TRINITY_DN8887_c0_g1_i2.p1 TRINITY_DN8887_c0_g1~~TRINITY_DN8887_c0_g1_i2.p1  ORF type:complete len:511 (+),score=116.86 TRINITY_DN8887_c0_g1_i2:85-1617(+)